MLSLSDKAEQLSQCLQKCPYLCAHTVWYCRSWNIMQNYNLYPPRCINIPDVFSGCSVLFCLMNCNQQSRICCRKYRTPWPLYGWHKCFPFWGTFLSIKVSHFSPERRCSKGIAQFFSFIPITLHIRNLSSHGATLEHISTHISPVLGTPKGERLCALFTNRSCHVTGKHGKWKTAMGSLMWQIIKATKGERGPSKFAEVHPAGLTEERPVLYSHSDPQDKPPVGVAVETNQLAAQGLTHRGWCQYISAC